MRVEKLPLTDFTGGLNDRDLGSGIALNEAQKLENYFTDNKGSLLRKRPGKDLVQFAPINPQPFTLDADTIALYHLDDAGPNYINEASASDIVEATGWSPDLTFSARQTLQADSIAGFDFARRFYPQLPTFIANKNGTPLARLDTTPFPNEINGREAVTFEAWVNPDVSWNGAPVFTGAAGHFSNSPLGLGVPIIGTANWNDPVRFNGPPSINNGLTIHRDWDYTAHKNATDIYVKFRIQTVLGTGFQVTEIQGGSIDQSKWSHIRGTYNSVTGLAKLFVNGALVAQGSTDGAVYDPPPSAELGLYGYFVGGLPAVEINPATGAVSSTFIFAALSCFAGMIDEIRISSVDRGSAGFPFDYPRGMGFEFAKSDGTRQAVISADSKLFFTLGDGNWTQMLMYGGALDAQGFTTPAFSTTDYWDAIFRKDILYLSNGVDNPLAWDGSTLVNWMGPIDAPILSLSAASGTITSGTRQVVYTYLYGDQETAFSPVAEIENPSGFQINVGGIPPRHANCTGVRIYMDKAGTPGTWYLVREIEHTPGEIMAISGAYTAGSPAAYDSDTGALGPADGSLGGSGYPLAESQVVTALSPNPQYLLAEHDRPFVAGMLNERYTLRWGELGAFDVFTVFSFAQAASNQGNLIALASYYGEVHASKDGRATLILRGANPQNWRVLETLHPTVGAIDHWSYVHRYPFGSDQYVLCFAARDGFYKYAGQQIECISDKINGTVQRLAQRNATRNEWDVTTRAQWMSQNPVPAPPGVTQNIQQPRYETDGLREDGGTAKIVNQLDYLGLWSDTAALVAGNVISVCKGVNEGEFYFATDAAVDLYWTPDNFVTVQTVAGTALQASERIIQIVRRATDDFYFLITDSAGTAGSSGGGNIYTVSDPIGTAGIGPIWTPLTGPLSANPGANPVLYYDLDVPVRMSGGGTINRGRLIGRLPVFNTAADSPNNLFINHAQSPAFILTTTNKGLIRPSIATVVISQAPGGTITSEGTYGSVLLTTWDHGLNGPDTITYQPSIGIGFYSYLAFENSSQNNLDVQSIQIAYTRREFPRWRGGTFGPQAYWDSIASRLVFLASTPETGGNRTTYLRTLTAAGVLINQYTAASVSAFTTDGDKVWFSTLEQFVGGYTTGTVAKFYQTVLSFPVSPAASSAYFNNLIPIRLSYNSEGPLSLLCAAKAISTGVQEFWTYLAQLESILVSALSRTIQKSLTASGDSGAVFSEIAVQTNDPGRWYVAVNRISAADPVAVYVVQPATLAVSSYKGEAYDSPSANAATNGILSNLLFVESSGDDGGNLWADRLYWFASAASSSDARMVQLGVPGDWTVIGVLESEAHNLGIFSAFDNLASDFDNHNNSDGLLYELRNAADTAALAAAVYQQQTPNSKIVGFAPVAAYVQWRVTFTWTFTAADGDTVTASPTVEFVNIGFFLGQANLPRTVGYHHEGRTFWTCAEDNSTENNVVLVYQKNGGWMKIYGWNLQSMFRFRNQMVALEGYQFMRLMTGTTDAGALIVGKARTGTIMGWNDKIISRVQANVACFSNNQFSSVAGSVKITPFSGDTELTEGAWVIPIPNAIANAPARVLGVPDVEFAYPWSRAFAVEIKTSEDTDGPWVPYVGQPEDIQAVDLELELTEDAYDIVAA